MVAFSDTLSDGVDLLGTPSAPYAGTGAGVVVDGSVDSLGSTNTVVGVAVVVFAGAVAFVVAFGECISSVV